MKPHAPKMITFWISLILVIIGVVGRFVSLGVISSWSWILVLIGYIVLALGVFIKGL